MLTEMCCIVHRSCCHVANLVAWGLPSEWVGDQKFGRCCLKPAEKALAGYPGRIAGQNLCKECVVTVLRAAIDVIKSQVGG